MRKIPTLYVRDPEHRARVTDEVTPGCEWVLAGEGVPTRKYDGTCLQLDDDGRWWARREVKAGKPEPAGFVAVETDEVTGKTVGWEPIEQSGYRKWFEQALAEAPGLYPTGTYELCGPKVNGNPEQFAAHVLVPHAAAMRLAAEGRSPVELVRDLAAFGFEGVVWHHPDGRMAKLKARDLR